MGSQGLKYRQQRNVKDITNAVACALLRKELQSEIVGTTEGCVDITAHCP